MGIAKRLHDHDQDSDHGPEQIASLLTVKVQVETATRIKSVLLLLDQTG